MTDISLIFSNILNVIKTFGFADLIDIVIVAFLIYEVLKFASTSRAMTLIKGIGLLLVLYFIAVEFNLRATSYLMGQVFSFGVIAVIVVFQPELRHALESVGKSNIAKFKFLSQLSLHEEKKDDALQLRDSITKIVDGVSELAKHDVGALIVFERDVKLGEIISTGTVIDAAPSKEMLGNLFFHNAPLHDGAAVIRGGRVYAAGCFLPLSQNYDISNMLGTRHRAALGMSENSDAVVIVVSEETGHISIAVDGVLTEHVDPVTLKRKLNKYLLPARKKAAEQDEGGEN